MVVDSSALLAVVFKEDDAAVFQRAMVEAPICRMSAATLVEASMVALGESDAHAAELNALLLLVRMRFEPVGIEIAAVARDAFARYGKGRHKAKLNFGDTFSYALAMHLSEPLLFKGSDFSETDITPAV